MAIALKRVYEPPSPEDGCRILVERLWPRGLTKQGAVIDLWCKEVAPSTELRRWFNHDSARWIEFQRRYVRELHDQAEALASIVQRARVGPVTFVFASREPVYNNAAALKAFLEKTWDQWLAGSDTTDGGR